MVIRNNLAATLVASFLVVCSCSGEPKATAHDDSTLRGATNTAAAMATSRTETQEVTALRLKDQATALHKAGEYEEAAKEFSKAADLLQGIKDSGENRRALPPVSPSLLSVVRCSLAAAQLKSGDLHRAEATCSQLLRTPGLGTTLRQKASYRRALARKRLAETEMKKEGEGARLAVKAYRDAYLAVKLSLAHTTGVERASIVPPQGDSKAAKLLEDMESADWGNGCLTERDRSAARTKAEEHLSSLAKASAVARTGFTSQGVGMFDMLNTTGVGNGGASSGELGRARVAEGGGVPEVLNIMISAAGRSGTGPGGLMDMLASGAKGVEGGGENTGPDKEQMVKMAKKMTKAVKKQLRDPGTQHFVCSFLSRAEPKMLTSLAEAAGIPVNEGLATRVSMYLKTADGKTLESWIDLGEIAAGVFRRMSQLSVLWSRGIALAGVWLVWVWLQACFASIVPMSSLAAA